jgi:hypothetical protein
VQVRRRRTLDAMKRVLSCRVAQPEADQRDYLLQTDDRSCEPKSGLVTIRVETISHSRGATNRAGIRPKCHGVCPVSPQRIRNRWERNCRITGTLLAQRRGESAPGKGQGGLRLPGYKKGRLHRGCAIWLRGSPKRFPDCGLLQNGRSLLWISGWSKEIRICLVLHDRFSYLDKSGGWAIGTGPSLVVLDQGAARSLTTTNLRSDVYAFVFSQRGLMGGIGLEGSKITKISPGE